MDLTGKSILITGIGGCIGSRLAERAVEAGMRVRGLQRSPDSQNLAQTLGIEMLQGCITDANIATRACEGMDIVVHAAALVSQQGAIETFRQINVQGSLTMAKAAREAGVKAFVQLSSVVVYGSHYPPDVTEAGPFYQGNNAYAVTKLESEQQVLALNHPPDFGVVVIRPGDVYGPRCLPWVVQPLQRMRGGDFYLLNNGRGTINHVYVDNLIDAIFLAIRKRAYGEAFNITDGCNTSWKEYYQRLADLEGLGPFKPLNANLLKMVFRLFPKLADGLDGEAIDLNVRRHAYSIEKARQLLGYQPRISLDEGMALTRAWLEHLLEKPPLKPTHDARPVLAVFDFDGTLTEKDSFMPFVSSVYPPRLVRWGIARRILPISGYVTGIRSNHFIKEKLITQYFKGKTQTEMETWAESYAQKQLPELLNPIAMERLKWHREQGHRIVIVSANLELYLKPWARQQGIDDVLASRLEFEANRVTGHLRGQSCYGPEKVSRLKSLVGALDQYYIYAYGDSKGDRELLTCADADFYRAFPSERQMLIR